MKNINYPVNFQFNITTFSNDFVAKDANRNTIAYVKQKMFKLKEDINIYNDETKSKVNYKIKADRWLDFSAAYTFSDEQGIEFGKIARKGWRSLWKATYEIIDNKQEKQYAINEENAWTKVFDSLLGEVPVLGLFTGYFFNPSYIVANNKNEPIVRLKKLPSFFGRKFEITKLGELGEDSNERIMLSLMMMILLERRRG
ncbi:MAG: hypothetical protein COX70_02925 [Flavobacteriales bacterium CG_4_10_14_0_2_um_filter_32_8]|nr:MAG: hypothetical protein COX70_02925 [Flavobacteriales bacterium CG_4_10_14_0_2_um_filter_32_8]PJB16052.1 MAG: hypothetical protein CO118_01280 [Flavobacteriales bacterium CG_4_9_14_3_um_filter_32_8]